MTTTQSLTTVSTASGLAAYSREAIDTIKATVAKGATDAELEMFLHLASRYGLDPFAKEIWCTKYVKQGQDPSTVAATIIVSRDGYLKAAQQDPDFDGISSGVVKEGDLFAFNPVNGTVSHEFGAKRGAILGAWAVVHHKRRRPVACFAEFGEYRGGSPIWQNYPSAMIQKVAEVHALKRQFGLSGVVSKEEMDYQTDDAEPSAVVRVGNRMIDAGTGEVLSAAAMPAPPVDAREVASRYLFATTRDAAKHLGITAKAAQECLKVIVKQQTGHDSTKDCDPDDLRLIADRLKEKPELLIPPMPDLAGDDIPAFEDGHTGSVDGLEREG